MAAKVALLRGGQMTSRCLLFMSWGKLSMLDNHIALAVMCYMQTAWETRGETGDMELALVKARVEAAAAHRWLQSIFMV